MAISNESAYQQEVSENKGILQRSLELGMRSFEVQSSGDQWTWHASANIASIEQPVEAA